jgi:hypothetical protein
MIGATPGYVGAWLEGLRGAQTIVLSPIICLGVGGVEPLTITTLGDQNLMEEFANLGIQAFTS